MIRYSITEDELRARIDKQSRGWTAKAEKATKELRKLGRFEDVGPSWSLVKPVYRSLQHNKCGYCERQLPKEKYSGAEHDIDHYRPKRACEPWPPSHWPPKSKGVSRLKFKPNTGRARGYPELAYQPLNYVATCKTCNEALKADYFPILGRPSAPRSEIGTLNLGERPLLLYPIGTLDSDPETIVTFEGIRAIPAASKGAIARRAEAVIELFQLNARDDLSVGRGHAIRRLWNDFEKSVKDKDAAAAAAVQRRLEPDEPHAGCVRAFYRLLQTSPKTAFRILEDAKAIAHKSP